MRKTAYLLTVAILMIAVFALPAGASYAGTKTTPAVTISPPSALQSGATDLTSMSIRGAPATSSLQGATTTLVQTFPMVPSIIRSTHYATADARLIFGLPLPALLLGTDMATTTTSSDYLQHSAISADAMRQTRTGADASMNVLGVSFTF